MELVVVIVNDIVVITSIVDIVIMTVTIVTDIDIISAVLIDITVSTIVNVVIVVFANPGWKVDRQGHADDLVRHACRY